MSTQNHDDPALWRAVIGFYRNEIERRYKLDSLRRFDIFEEIPDRNAEQLRAFFMQKLYPPLDERARLDDAINRLGDVLKSPKRLRPLMKSALGSVWKLGPSLPKAISAGTSTLDAYIQSRALEEAMVDAAAKKGVKAKDASKRAVMLGIIGEIPERDVMRLVRDILNVFRALSNTKMLQTAVDFLDTSKEIMVANSNIFLPEEIEGITIGRDLVNGGLQLFLDLDPALYPVIIEGIEQVEMDWYASVTAAKE